MRMSDTDPNARFVHEFARHESAIRAYVRRLVPSRTDSDDIFQEVAIVLWKKFHQLRAESDFRAWAFGVARFKVLSWLRDNGRRRLVLASDVVELIAAESLSEEPYLEQQRLAFEACMDQLPSHQKSLLVEAYRRDVKMQDVAAASGRSMAGFYQWLYRMRQNLLTCAQRKLAQEATS